MILHYSQGWRHFQARFAEWQNSAIMFFWGLYLILHPGMFDNPKLAVFIGLKQIAPQETWGLACLAVGLGRGIALYINGRSRRTPTVRLIASFLSAFIITQIALGISNSGVASTGLVLYPILVLTDLYSAFRASADMTFVARDAVPEEDRTESHRVVNIAARS